MIRPEALDGGAFLLQTSRVNDRSDSQPGRAHARAGNNNTGPLYLEHPKFEGFEVKQTVSAAKSTAA